MTAFLVAASAFSCSSLARKAAWPPLRAASASRAAAGARAFGGHGLFFRCKGARALQVGLGGGGGIALALDVGPEGRDVRQQLGHSACTVGAAALLQRLFLGLAAPSARSCASSAVAAQPGAGGGGLVRLVHLAGSAPVLFLELAGLGTLALIRAQLEQRGVGAHPRQLALAGAQRHLRSSRSGFQRGGAATGCPASSCPEEVFSAVRSGGGQFGMSALATISRCFASACLAGGGGGAGGGQFLLAAAARLGAGAQSLLRRRRLFRGALQLRSASGAARPRLRQFALDGGDRRAFALQVFRQEPMQRKRAGEILGFKLFRVAALGVQLLAGRACSSA